ncbi:U3 small nucleolar RNA-associated protein 25 homolog isoform X3 [Salvia splendens]|uniref:U3 small nucleolar RNA-associated protein 25 homolog isoform X3 n=1 Tax=Salvia splendens TaxID=180675 RepID=UPI001C26D882|nr:U3 small nucleolar RNA-associated protein 25 homolog isoform X3 [Salvia splendens]
MFAAYVFPPGNFLFNPSGEDLFMMFIVAGEIGVHISLASRCELKNEKFSSYPVMWNWVPSSYSTWCSIDAHVLIQQMHKFSCSIEFIYEHFDIESIVEADNARLKYFSDKGWEKLTVINIFLRIFPKIKDSVQDGVMIFASSYFEYVRLRNYLKSQSASVCLFGEYIKRNEISHVRGEFFRGEKKIMLYTERAHFYYRYKICGVKNLIIYSLPDREEFYPQIINFLEESDNMNCRVLFSRLDNLRLERIDGSTAAKRKINSDKGVFVFA